MDKLLLFINSIDWIFAAVLLIGGRYWGTRYFRLFKNKDWNFLAFATIFGGLWILIQVISTGIQKEAISNLFITYIFVTSFYQLFARKIFILIEKWAGTDTGFGDKYDPDPEEYATRSFFPAVGVSGKWYLDISTGNYWYWDGRTYQNGGIDRPQKPPPNP